MRYYGLKDDVHATTMALDVVRVFGGGFRCVQALIGICCVETNLGRFEDAHPDKWGVGLTQFDQIGFDDVKARTRNKDKIKLEKEFGYVMKDLVLKDLKDDPLLALCFARLKYKLIPDDIPADIPGQARYWKRFYNTAEGKGTVEKYLEKWELYAPISVK